MEYSFHQTSSNYCAIKLIGEWKRELTSCCFLNTFNPEASLLVQIKTNSLKAYFSNTKKQRWIAIFTKLFKDDDPSSMLRLDQAGNLTYFHLKVKHLSILPDTWQVVWYRYYW